MTRGYRALGGDVSAGAEDDSTPTALSKTDRLLAAEDRQQAGPIDWVATGSCFAFPALGGLLFGYDIGATSGALVSLTSADVSGTSWYALSSLQTGLVVSSSLFGALAGSLGALAMGNRQGRRQELLQAAVLYGVGSMVMALSPTLPVLVGGHLAYGLGIGIAMHAAPAYIAETAPPSARGLLISLKEAAIVGGILLGYLASYIWIGAEGGWRFMLGAAAPLAVLLLVGMATLPETPRYLLLAGKGREEAEAALRKAQGAGVKGDGVAQAMVEEMDHAVKEARASEGGKEVGLAQLLTERRYVRPLAVGVALMALQQVTGQPSVLYYAASIFQGAGFGSAADATGAAVVLGAWKLAMTMVAVAYVDKVGRRPLLLGGVSAMTLALVLLGSAFGSSGAAAAWTSVLALLLYVGAYQVSFGPISWLIVGEVFPLAVRSQAIAVATFVNFGSNFLVSLALPSLQAGVGMSATYLSFAAIASVAVGVIWTFVPETKGKSLEEIEAMWGPREGGKGRPV